VLTGIRYSDPMIRARRWRPGQPAQKHVNDHGDSTFANNPFLEDLLEWRHSPEGEQFAELADALCDLIDDMQFDAKQLHNGSISSSQHVKKQYCDFRRDWIEQYLIDLDCAAKQNSFFALEPLEVFDCNIVLPLAFTELHHWTCCCLQNDATAPQIPC
jgi:hypothetical protein